MARHNLEDHKFSCVREIDNPFTKVHVWMDAPSWGLRRKHRRYRHNILETPKQVRALFGSNADKACINHIILDFLDDPNLNAIAWLRDAVYRYLVEREKRRSRNHHEVAQFFREQYNVMEVTV